MGVIEGLNMGCACNKQPCQCGPQPYYSTVKMCPEDNKETVIIQEYRIAIKIVNSWNIPVCGASAILDVEGLVGASLGSFLWNKQFGYYEITGVAENQLQITNTCLLGNVVAGTQVPACSDFIVTDPPSDLINNSGVYVKYDFTAPANNTCLDITVTSVQGLVEGNEVQIGSGIYFLNAVNPNDIINICNYDNKGITPGTPVIAKNAGGNYQYPVTVISVNPCSQDPVFEGKVIVCDNTTQKILTGNTDGDFCYLVDHVNSIAEFGTPPAITTINNEITTINADIVTINADLAALYSVIGSNTSANKTGGPLGVGGSLTSNVAALTLVNASSVNSENVLFVVTAWCDGDIAHPHTKDGTLEFQLNIDRNGGGATVELQEQQIVYLSADVDIFYSNSLTWSIPITIAPSATYNLQASLTISNTAPNFPDYNITTLQVKIDAIGVAV